MNLSAPRAPQPPAPAVQQHYCLQVSPAVHPKVQQSMEQQRRHSGRNPTWGCYHCHDLSHLISRCPHLQRSGPTAAPAVADGSLGHLLGRETQAALPAAVPALRPNTM
mmetsp:Transcript_18751/g.35137  ORF Transcript_18751/g.35137 Transcript_18751/m.35137 type:complete len:108 (-) Transcript_18751:27-350(-)